MNRWIWVRERDDYGRSAHKLLDGGWDNVAGVVVKLPRGYTEKYPGHNYLANDWRLADRDAAVSYHATLAEAKARLEGA